MTERDKILDWLKDKKSLLKLFRFDTKQPGNLGSNRELYKTLIQEYPFEIEKKEFFGLVKLYLEKDKIDDAFCTVCGKLCKCKSDYSFYDACSKECGRTLAAKKTSLQYMNKTEEEKQAIKNKRKATNLERYGVTTNLQTKEVCDKRINKYGSNTPFASEDIRKKITENNKLKHEGLANSFQWEETKQKCKKTKLERYNDAKYSNPEQIEKTCLAKYGVKSYMCTEEFRQKAKDTCLEKYGVDYFSKAPEIKEQIKATNRSKYNADWYMQTDEFKEKTKKWCLENFGVEFNCMRKDLRDKSKAKSQINMFWKKLLGIKDNDTEFAIGHYLYDLKKNNTLIEINPTVTHNSVFSIFKTDKPKEPDYHLNKSKSAEEAGYRCIHVWDWDDTDKIRMLVQNKSAIYARKCKIQEVSKEDCDEFLNKYHIQNTCKGQTVRLGLYYNDNLVEIMTFGKPRYNKKHEWELLRLCTAAGFVVVGGAMKLFKHFITTYSPNSIISYCDRCKFTGEIYTNLGFTLKSISKPAKHWYNTKTKQHFTDNLVRQLGVDKLLGTSFGKGTSNEKILLDKGFVTIYDCGQASYVWHSAL